MTCTHKPAHLYTWFARDDSTPNGKRLVIACKSCKTIITGKATP